jgi:hypothetical protein
MELKSEVIQAITAEYTSLRTELIQKHANLIQLFSIYLTLLGVTYGVVATKDLYDGILLIPLPALALFARYLQDSAIIATISDYIHDEIEARKLPAALGYVPNCDDVPADQPHQRLWQSWNHYYNWRFRHTAPIHKIPLFIIYFLLSVVPAILFAIINLWELHYGRTGFTRIPIEVAGYYMGSSLVISIFVSFFILIGLFAPRFWVNTKK